MSFNAVVPTFEFEFGAAPIGGRAILPGRVQKQKRTSKRGGGNRTRDAPSAGKGIKNTAAAIKTTTLNISKSFSPHNFILEEHSKATAAAGIPESTTLCIDLSPTPKKNSNSRKTRDYSKRGVKPLYASSRTRTIGDSAVRGSSMKGSPKPPSAKKVVRAHTSPRADKIKQNAAAEAKHHNKQTEVPDSPLDGMFVQASKVAAASPISQEKERNVAEAAAPSGRKGPAGVCLQCSEKC